jgi:hypothetical protein
MIECGNCNGTGVCHNPVHGPFQNEDYFEPFRPTPDPSALSCTECGERPGSPGQCVSCGGKGHYGDEDQS